MPAIARITCIYANTQKRKRHLTTLCARVFSSPGRSPGIAIVLPPASASASALALASVLAFAAASALAKC